MRKLTILLAIIGIVLFCWMSNILLNPNVPPQLVEDTLKIKELEGANDNYLRDLKLQLMEAIDEAEAEKVVFYVNYQNSVEGYLVTIYFKKGGKWYETAVEQFDSRLSNKLREELGDLIW